MEDTGHGRPHSVWFHLQEKLRLGKSTEKESKCMAKQGFRGLKKKRLLNDMGCLLG